MAFHSTRTYALLRQVLLYTDLPSPPTSRSEAFRRWGCHDASPEKAFCGTESMCLLEVARVDGFLCEVEMLLVPARPNNPFSCHLLGP